MDLTKPSANITTVIEERAHRYFNSRFRWDGENGRFKDEWFHNLIQEARTAAEERDLNTPENDTEWIAKLAVDYALNENPEAYIRDKGFSARFKQVLDSIKEYIQVILENAGIVQKMYREGIIKDDLMNLIKDSLTGEIQTSKVQNYISEHPLLQESVNKLNNIENQIKEGTQNPELKQSEQKLNEINDNLKDKDNSTYQLGENPQIYTPEFKKWFGDWENASLATEVSEYIDKSIDKKANDKPLSLGEVNPYLNKKLKTVLGYDIYKHEINSNDLRHMLKQHGKDEFPITKDTLKIIPYILQNPTNIEAGSINPQGRLSVKISKKIDGKIIYIEAETEKKGVLAGKTMYITPSGRDNAKGPVHTSKTAPGPSYKEIIAQILNNANNSSKVVDKNGKPLVVYHGSGEEYNIFDKSKRGSNTDPGIFGKGFYFSANKRTALSYGKNIKELYLSIQNPFYINNFKTKQELADYLEIDESIISEGGRGFKVQTPFSGLFSDSIKEKGHDGVITKDGEYVAFSSSQIKSATGNRGTFDSSNPDITYQLAEVSKSFNEEEKTRLTKLIDQFKSELDRKSLNEEQKGIYDVVTGDKKKTKIQKDDLDILKGFITLEQVHKKRGAIHILLDHYNSNKGSVTAEDIVNIGKTIRSSYPIISTNAKGQTSHKYIEYKNNIKYQVVVGISRNEFIITFYSNNDAAVRHNADSAYTTTTASSRDNNNTTPSGNVNTTNQLASLPEITRRYIENYDTLRKLENTFEKFGADWYVEQAHNLKQQILGRIEEITGREAPFNQGRAQEDSYIRGTKTHLRYMEKDEYATEKFIEKLHNGSVTDLKYMKEELERLGKQIKAQSYEAGRLNKAAQLTKDDIKKIQKELQLYISAAPPEVRSNYRLQNRLTTLANIEGAKARERYINKTLEVIDELIEENNKWNQIKEMYDDLRRFKERKDSSGRLISKKLTPSIQKQIKDIQNAMKMGAEGVESEINKLMFILEQNGEWTEEELRQFLIFDTFGNIIDKTSNEVSQARDELNSVIEKGVMQRELLENQFRQKMTEFQGRTIDIIFLSLKLKIINPKL